VTDDIEDVFTRKMDAPLLQLYHAGRLDPAAQASIVIRCDAAHVDHLTALVATVGGTVRHEIRAFGVLATSIPLTSIAALAQDRRVRALELEQEFEIGSVWAASGHGAAPVAF